MIGLLFCMNTDQQSHMGEKQLSAIIVMNSGISFFFFLHFTFLYFLNFKNNVHRFTTEL